MERRTSTNKIKVFKFGGRTGDTENEAFALDQIWLQNKYRNALVRIDREFRSRYGAIVGVDNPAFDCTREIDVRIKKLRAVIKLHRTGVRRADWKALSLPEKAEIKALEAERKALKPEADRLRNSNKITYQAKIEALNKEFYAACKVVRAKFADGSYTWQDKHGTHDLGGKKLFWMNEEHVYNNFLKDRDAAMRHNTPLNFHRFEPEGVVTCRPRVRVVESSGRPMTVLLNVKSTKPKRVLVPPNQVAHFLASNPHAKLARADTQRLKYLQSGVLGESQKVQRSITATQGFDPTNKSAFFFTLQNTGGHETSRRSQRLIRAFAHLQVGGNPKTFFVLPVTLHRNFPEGAILRSVAAKRERVARNYRWSLLVTVDFPPAKPAHGTGIVALDPGWAMRTLADADGRLRVGGLTNENGDFEELSLSPKFLSQLEQVDRLQSIIAKEINVVIPKVQEWLDKHTAQSDVHMHLQNAVLAHSNAKRRERQAGGFRHLIKAVLAIRNGVQLDDLEVQCALEEWYKKFRHHDEWMRNLADQNDCFTSLFSGLIAETR